jgi:hypothetical protein
MPHSERGPPSKCRAFETPCGIIRHAALRPSCRYRHDGKDGSLDLALSGNDATSAFIARIYRNYSNGVSNAPPGAPSNLTNVVFRKSVRLSWNTPTDANQPAGLSYNLRVGTSPGSGNIVSPLSDSSGMRKVVAPGNTSERQSWTITNLAGGTFYWSVQTVDHLC